MEEESLTNGGSMESNCKAVNGFTVVVQNGGGDGNFAGSSVKDFRTYKRRKHTKMSSSKTQLIQDGKVSIDSSGQCPDKNTEPSEMVLNSTSCQQVSLARRSSRAFMNGSKDSSLKQWRNIVLEQMCQQISGSEGGLQECIRDALIFHPENGCTNADKESVHSHEGRQQCSSHRGSMPNGTRNAAKGNLVVMSNGALNEPNHCTITELVQQNFLDVVTSEKFSQLCKILLENFQGMKLDSFFDIRLINSRFKEGSYERYPMLYHADIQKVWSKLQKVGTEMVALAKSLSDKSRTSYCEQDSDMHAKVEQTEACGMYGVCTCCQCGEKADGRHCLVCDSCEEMYHVSCIEPAVEEIPLKSWYCSNCTAKGIESPPHENCSVCERLAAPRSSINGDGVDEDLTTEEALSEDGLQPSKGRHIMSPCNVCRCKVENGEKFRVCGHLFCSHKYYHIRCLTSKQLKSYGPRWYCPSCLCRACLTDQDDDKIVLCDCCDHAYHIYCMQPPRSSIPRGKWFCRKCDAGMQHIRNAKRAYENMQNNLQRRAEGGKGSFENLRNEQKENGEEAFDKSGGVDMLLNAAKTLNYEESMAAMQMKR
ncbi:unnamed protein product [Ilex paraguariensis]|uniref:PHD-type domain-containing protein n=1 Tax=Ilex paraguariensis TaxID=185542 RepID=A0ABC8R100_9AQUA